MQTPNPLKQYLQANGLSCAEFGRMVGANASQVWRIAAGERAPSASLLVAIHRETNGAVPFDTWADRHRKKGAPSKKRKATPRRAP